MRILYVYGDDDYAATTFEGDYKFNDIVKKAEENDNEIEFEEGMYAKILEFGEVDEKFIEFMKKIQDYDDSKHHNFYIIEEK